MFPCFNIPRERAKLKKRKIDREREKGEINKKWEQARERAITSI